MTNAHLLGTGTLVPMFRTHTAIARRSRRETATPSEQPPPARYRHTPIAADLTLLREIGGFFAVYGSFVGCRSPPFVSDILIFKIQKRRKAL